jgi:hypothetical protein
VGFKHLGSMEDGEFLAQLSDCQLLTEYSSTCSYVVGTVNHKTIRSTNIILVRIGVTRSRGSSVSIVTRLRA